MNRNSPPLPIDECIRLGGDAVAFVESLDHLGSVLLQARCSGGGFGKFIPANSLLVDLDSGRSVDPDNGLVIDLGNLVAVHAVPADPETDAKLGFDFEFVNQPAALSYYAVSGLSDGPAFNDLAAQFFGATVSMDHLDEWRSDLLPKKPECGGCREAQKRRSLAGYQHPLAQIMQELVRQEATVRCRLTSPSVDFAGWITVGNVVVEQGLVIVRDLMGDGVLHIDLRDLCKMRILEKSIDGEFFAALEIFGQNGELTFEILAFDLRFINHWRAICESSRHQNNEPQ